MTYKGITIMTDNANPIGTAYFCYTGGARVLPQYDKINDFLSAGYQINCHIDDLVKVKLLIDEFRYPEEFANKIEELIQDV